MTDPGDFIWASHKLTFIPAFVYCYKKKKKILGFQVTKCANLSERDCWTSCHRNEVNKLKYERTQELHGHNVLAA